MRIISAFALAFLLAGPAPAWAAMGFGPSSNKGGDQPLSIEAEDGIEWQQQSQVYVARGNARAVQGDVTVVGDTLTAHYRQTKSGDTEIWRVVAEGNVRISSGTQWATGDRGVYDVDKGVLVMTGRALRLEMQQEKITAKQSLEYWDQKRLAVARGDAVAIKDGRELRGDVLSAVMRETKTGQLEVARLEAFGNVQVATQSEVAKANYGDYSPDTGIANLAGSVRITRGTNQLNGEFAEVNMKTGISKLLSQPKAASGAGKRVHGVFQPKSAPKPPAQ